MGGSIFISYRRETDSAFAGRLYDHLEPSFGRERVFIDVDSIAPGEDFVAVLESRVAACDVLLVLIGRGWLAATDAGGRRRLDNPHDFVRIEIAAALTQGKRVIPVLSDDAAMPQADNLPDEIKPLARRNAIRLTHERFRDDAERLVHALEKSLADAEAARQAEEGARKAEEERQRAAAEAKRRAEDEERRRLEEARRQSEAEATKKAEEERQRAAAEAKRQAQDQERHRTEEEVKLQATGEKTSSSGPRWIIGAVILLAVVVGALLVWPSSEQAPVSPVTTEQKVVTQSPAVDAEKALEEKALAPRTFRDCAACPEMVALPGGTFLMGSSEGEEGRDPDEGPQHRVTIGAFAIGKHEVTFEQWDACVAAGGCNGYRPDDGGWGRGRRPVINVSWEDTQTYVTWLAEATGKLYRLPSEAEWEYAARAGTTTRYAFGDAITEKDANFGMNRGKTTEVGAYPANPWGLHDMHGNVWEWVEDVWHDSYQGLPADGAAWTNGKGKYSSRLRVYRGGCWYNNYLGNLRAASRDRGEPDIRGKYLGFRVARTVH
jgi:formylglycine-generating enzyme required for sulfatase activity